jgi:hypothetical protein
MKGDEHSYQIAKLVKIFPPRIFEENCRDVFHPT